MSNSEPHTDPREELRDAIANVLHRDDDGNCCMEPCSVCARALADALLASELLCAERASLFKRGDFTMHSGATGRWKIECDAFTDADIECLAFMLAERVSPFRRVEGIPRGGLRLAAAMEKYASPDAVIPLVVDDVLTTGASFADWVRAHPDEETRGAVLFARSDCPDWVTPLFSMETR